MEHVNISEHNVPITNKHVVYTRIHNPSTDCILYTHVCRERGIYGNSTYFYKIDYKFNDGTSMLDYIRKNLKYSNVIKDAEIESIYYLYYGKVEKVIKYFEIQEYLYKKRL